MRCCDLSYSLYWINNTKCKNLWPCLKTLSNTLLSTLRNTIHGSSNMEHASKSIEMIFGEVEFGPDGSIHTVF